MPSINSPCVVQQTEKREALIYSNNRPIPVLLLHLAGSKQLLDLMCHILLPGQHHYTRGFFVQTVAQMQRLCLVATKHLCQDGQYITDAELDSRAT